jgi:hypothetical protein
LRVSTSARLASLRESPFASFHEVLQPLVIDVGADAFSAAEDADGYFSADALDENPDFLLRSEAASRDLLGVWRISY